MNPTVMHQITALHSSANHVGNLSVLGSSRQSALISRFINARAFENRTRYGLFLKVQHEIERDLADLYSHPMRVAVLPSQAPGRYRRKLAQDLNDLHLQQPRASAVNCFGDMPFSLAALCGILFVAEGSRLLWPWFRRQANMLGFDDDFGARHLACDPSEIRSRWSDFVSCVNGMCFTTWDMQTMAIAFQQTMRHFDAVITLTLGNPGRIYS